MLRSDTAVRENERNTYFFCDEFIIFWLELDCPLSNQKLRFLEITLLGTMNALTCGHSSLILQKKILWKEWRSRTLFYL